MRVKGTSPIRKISCIHCGSDTLIKKSREVSWQYRELTCHCLNDECGCVFISAVTPVRILVPSAAPNEAVKIPLSQRVNVQQLVLSLNEPGRRA